MEGSEESPVYRVPPVDRVSARTRGSRPVGPPPPSNTFDVRQPLPTDGGATGTLQKPLRLFDHCTRLYETSGPWLFACDQ